MKIKPADFTDPQLIALLHLHLDGMRACTPPEHVFALDLSGLENSTITLLTAWKDDKLLACGALKEISPQLGEIKSMRTYPQFLRQGAASCVLQALIDLARARGYERLSLETGSGKSFSPSHGLYQRFGFSQGAPFADYKESDFSQYFHLRLI